MVSPEECGKLTDKEIVRTAELSRESLCYPDDGTQTE
jgi:hypothetical protein